MKNILLFSLLIIIPVLVFSQNISVKTFKMLDNDLDALVNYPEIDQSNGDKAALIKIMTTEKGFDFGGGQLGIVKVVYKTAEIWVYVPAKLKAITIAHPKLGQLPNKFYNFDIPIVSGKVYLMELVTGTIETIVKKAEITTQWLAINSKPEGASVFIEEQLVGVTPFSRKYPEGDYTYRLELPQYQPQAGKVKLVGEKKVIELILKPNFGNLQITSSPEVGMLIYLDEQNTGKTTPATLEGVSSGEHTLKLISQWYQPQSKRITVSNEQTTISNLIMTPAFADITITTNPIADILIDGKIVGNGNYTTRLLAGIYIVKADKEKHYSDQQQVTIVAGGKLTIPLTLKPKVGILDIASTPFDATITLDGKDYGVTPNTIKNLLVGDYTLTLKKIGYGTITKILTINENLTVEVDEKLPTGMEVIVTSIPSGAIITLDGVSTGKTPYTTTLGFGTHNLKLVNGEKEVNETINVEQNGKTNFEFNVSAFTEIEMVLVKGGSFSMGSDKYEWEKPIHGVTLNDFYIGKYEVTQAQWQTVMGSNPSKFIGCDDCPVESVSWDEVQEFIQKLNRLSGKTYRLPTEAEWEYAANGGLKSKGFYSSGSSDVGSVAWYDGNSGRKTHPVGQKLPNELGIYDMTGNVYEWCSDWYSSTYYSTYPSNNPQGPNTGFQRVSRGAGCRTFIGGCYTSARGSSGRPNTKQRDLGFRLVSGSK